MTTPNSEGRGFLSVTVTGTTATTGGAMCSVKNPEGVACKILRSFLYVATPSTGAANINVGVGAAATTDGSDMASALAINGSLTGKIYALSVGGDATKDDITAPATWTAGYYVNCTGSADSSGFAGTLFIEYVRVA